MGENSMRKFLAIAFVCIALGASKSGGSAGFKPPDVASASDITYPFNNAASGMVSLSANLNAEGKVQSVQVLRDVAGLTDQATAAVNSWSFSPARLNGHPVPSIIDVHVVFNPGIPQTQSLSLPPSEPLVSPNPAGYLPPEIAAASYANYPPNSIGAGTVVLSLTIDGSGNIENVSVVRRVPSLTAPSIAAVKTWTINPARYNGKGITSKMAVAFVYRLPMITTD